MNVALKREQEPNLYLPYVRHEDDSIIALGDGSLIVVLELDGRAFETAAIEDINTQHAQLNHRWRNFSSSNAADKSMLWHHIIRAREVAHSKGTFKSGFSLDLDARYQQRTGRVPLLANSLYLTLMVRGASAAVQRAARLTRFLSRDSQAAKVSDENLEIIKDMARDMVAGLARYGARQLSLVEHDGLIFSQPMSFLSFVMYGQKNLLPLVNGKIGPALYQNRIIFGRESLEIRGAGEQRFGAILGIKEYPAKTRAGMLDKVLGAPFEFVMCHSARPIRKADAQTIMTRKQNQMISGRDKAASQILSLTEAVDELASGEFALCEHNFSFLVYGETPEKLARNVSAARSELADAGMVVAREDLAIESAFWAQLPGNQRFRPRSSAITTRNFASFAPFHTYPSGRPDGNHWGPAVTILKTASGGPFHFNFHTADRASTFICGPTGSGKTVIQNFMLSQLEKFDAQLVCVDKDRGAEVFVRASGGTYLPLELGVSTGFAPLKHLDLTPENLVFLSSLIRKLVARPDRPITTTEGRDLEAALAGLHRIPKEQRSLSALRAQLGQRDPEGIGARLERWCQGGSLGWVLDNSEDVIKFDAKMVGFDMTKFLDDEEIRLPVLSYLFYRVEQLIDGRRIFINIDEAWRVFDDPNFSAFVKDGLKTIRKRNGVICFGTQSPSDVLKSGISKTILEQCPTKIYLRNPNASREDYIGRDGRDGFGLTEREFKLIKEEFQEGDRKFLVKQGQDSVVVVLDLGGFTEELAVLSGTERGVLACQAARQQAGEDPKDWLPVFYRLLNEAGAA